MELTAAYLRLRTPFATMAFLALEITAPKMAVSTKLSTNGAMTASRAQLTAATQHTAAFTLPSILFAQQATALLDTATLPSIARSLTMMLHAAMALLAHEISAT